ncbi:carbamoyl-phosphate synthase [Arenicellales bacterium nBUS_45]
MNRFTPVVASLLLLVVYPIFAQDISVEDTVNFDLRAIGQTQGAGVPNAIGAGAFIPLHKTSNAVTYVDIEAKANLDDRSGDSSIINTDVAGTTLSTSTRLGYRRLNESGQMYGVYAGYDTRELKAGPVDTNVVVTDPRTVDFQQAALGAEFVSNQWRFDVYALIPTGDTEQQLNSHYEGGALETYGADVGYQINDKTKVTVGYYHQNGDVGEASGSGASAGLNYDITNNLTAGLKVSYDDAFETRVMATINWSFADLFKGDEAQTEATTNTVMNTLNASPEQRDVRVHDGVMPDPPNGILVQSVVGGGGGGGTIGGVCTWDECIVNCEAEGDPCSDL